VPSGKRRHHCSHVSGLVLVVAVGVVVIENLVVVSENLEVVTEDFEVEDFEVVSQGPPVVSQGPPVVAQGSLPAAVPWPAAVPNGPTMHRAKRAKRHADIFMRCVR